MRIFAFVTVTKMQKFAFVTFAFLTFAFLQGNRFMYHGSKLYNMLPEETKLAPTYKAFKTKVKAWIKNNIAVKP